MRLSLSLLTKSAQSLAFPVLIASRVDVPPKKRRSLLTRKCIHVNGHVLMILPPFLAVVVRRDPLPRDWSTTLVFPRYAIDQSRIDVVTHFASSNCTAFVVSSNQWICPPLFDRESLPQSFDESI